MNNNESKIKWTSQVFERENRFTVPSQDLKLILTELSKIEERQENFLSKNNKKLNKLLGNKSVKFYFLN